MTGLSYWGGNFFGNLQRLCVCGVRCVYAKLESNACRCIMTSQTGASIQTYNSELVRCLEDLKAKREQLNQEIFHEDQQKSDTEKKIQKLSETLHHLEDSLAHKTQARGDYDTTIQETESAYMKILESSQTLLHVLKKETANLSKRKQNLPQQPNNQHTSHKSLLSDDF
jgi:Sjoegren syndrome nuclear autoantigen 1